MTAAAKLDNTFSIVELIRLAYVELVTSRTLTHRLHYLYMRR